jgi:hypothetical protein
MKKLIPILFFVLVITSCEKKIPCWECITKQTKDITLINIYCDKTADEIKDIEVKGTFYHNLFGEYWHQTTVCRLK